MLAPDRATSCHFTLWFTCSNEFRETSLHSKALTTSLWLIVNKWPSCVPLHSLKSTIAEIKRIFCDFGTPEEALSNYGSEFDCAEFQAFCDQRYICSVCDIYPNLRTIERPSGALHSNADGGSTVGVGSYFAGPSPSCKSPIPPEWPHSAVRASSIRSESAAVSAASWLFSKWVDNMSECLLLDCGCRMISSLPVSNQTPRLTDGRVFRRARRDINLLKV